MFGMNFSELLLIAVVAFVVIGPKELPVVIRHVAAFIRELRALTSGVRAQMHAMAREAGVDDIFTGTTTIIDLEGKPQKAYDVRELARLSDDPSPVDPMIRLSDDPKTTEHGSTDNRGTE